LLVEAVEEVDHPHPQSKPHLSTMPEEFGLAVFMMNITQTG
jgi:hypothetical protein